MIRTATAILLLAALTGCSSTGQPAGSAQKAVKFELTASLISPIDITLDWSGTPADVTSTIVEFATEPEGRYTILDFLPAGEHTYKHPDLMPKTPFYYRVTPVLGPASAAVDVRLPAATTFRAGTTDAASRGSVKAAAGTPTNVTAKSLPDNGIRVTWTDNATDEEGYLLEIKPHDKAEYRVAGFIDPDSTFTELSTVPEERNATYRVRAFYRGQASNLAHQTTGTGTP